jgi:signal transduction histidine kinase
MNLLGNAVKYTSTGTIVIRSRLVQPADASIPTHLRLATEMNGLAVHPWLTLQVVDSGVGIAKADHGRIFEEFEQVNAGPRGESMTRGTGLGLPISRRLARLLGGDVTLTSDVGQGATFTVWLPTTLEPSAASTDGH